MQRIYINTQHPQPRLVSQITHIINNKGVVVCPTDTSYVFIAKMGEKAATDKIAHIRRLDEHHQYTLLCKDLSEIANYAKLSNSMFRLLKAHTPSKCTFILPATSDVPRRLQHPKKKTIGIRICDNAVVQAILNDMNEPLLCSTLILPNEEYPMDDPEEITDTLGHQIDCLIDTGILTRSTTTVLDCTEDTPSIVRQGDEDVSGWW